MHRAMLWSAAAYDLGLAMFHILFWRLFGWPARLQPSGRINAAITQTLNIMLIYVFVVYAASILLLPPDIARVALWAGTGFWCLRAALQPVIFNLNRRQTILLTGAFALGALLHAAAAAW